MPAPRDVRLVAETGQVATPTGQEVEVSLGNLQVVTQSGAVFHEAGNAGPGLPASLFDSISAAGQRGAQPPAVSQALVAYWLALQQADREQRAALLPLVRDAIRRGATTPRAWLCIALGDPDFQLVRDATAGYLGAPAVSVERRGQCVIDVVDWIVRELPLNRAAAFAALVDLNDAVVLEQLTGLRGRLSVEETSTVWAIFEATASPAIGEFIAQWRSDGSGCR
jgi:hypothetical protein